MDSIVYSILANGLIKTNYEQNFTNEIFWLKEGLQHDLLNVDQVDDVDGG